MAAKGDHSGAAMRRIVLVGNFQFAALAGLYEQFVAVRTGEQVTHVPPPRRNEETAKVAIRQADVLVEQTGMPPGESVEGHERIAVPLVAAPFLWPFAGEPHPRNAAAGPTLRGPYTGEMGDRYLNRLIAEGVAPEAALARYRDLDVAREVDLDALLATGLAQQQARDAATGFRIAEAIEARFRAEPLFRSPNRPNARILRLLARQLFERLGARGDEIDRMQRATIHSPFPREALAVHPAVARHFGLRWAAPERRYPVLLEGAFTFDEYVLRYMRCEWNEALEPAMRLAHGEDLELAETRLRAALARTPQSGNGQNALRIVLARGERFVEALTAGERAVQADPGFTPYRIELANLLRRLGRLDEAEGHFRQAIAQEPGDPKPLLLLAQVLLQRGKPDAAAVFATNAMRFAPHSTAPRDLLRRLAGA
jgi:tetratricopeptide (TPR) repeat protein